MKRSVRVQSWSNTAFVASKEATETSVSMRGLKARMDEATASVRSGFRDMSVPK
jgi:hypothetical protein